MQSKEISIGKHTGICARSSFELLAVVGFLLLGLGSCGGQAQHGGEAQPLGNRPTENSSADSLSALVVPNPSTILARERGVKAVSWTTTHDACDFLDGYNQHVNTKQLEAGFAPEWISSTSPFSAVAYAVYSFDLQGWYGRPMLHTQWSAAPADFEQLWVGVSDWPRDRWEWLRGEADGTLDLGLNSLERFKDVKSRKTYVVVLLLGQSGGLLRKLWFTGVNSLRGDWWMHGHDARHTSRSRFVGPDSPSLKWSQQIAYKLISLDTPPIYGNRIPAVYDSNNLAYVLVDQYIVGGEHDHLTAWTVGGTIAWRRSLTVGGTTSGQASPAIMDDGTVSWAIARGGNLLAVDCTNSGAQKWVFQGHLGMISPSTISPDNTTLVMGVNDSDHIERYLHAVNTDGTLQWEHFFGAQSTTAPAVAQDGTVYVGCGDAKLYAFNPDGAVKWTYTAGAPIISDPSIADDGTIYCATAAPELLAVRADGTQKWAAPLPDKVDTMAAIAADGTLRLCCADGKLYSFSAQGEQLWSYNTGLSLSAPALDAQGTAFVGTNGSKVLAVKTDGLLFWSYTTTGMVQVQPTLSEDGSLHFMDVEGWFYALGPGAE